MPMHVVFTTITTYGLTNLLMSTGIQMDDI